jgi:hypothetical protein
MTASGGSFPGQRYAPGGYPKKALKPSQTGETVGFLLPVNREHQVEHKCSLGYFGHAGWPLTLK